MVLIPGTPYMIIYGYNNMFVLPPPPLPTLLAFYLFPGRGKKIPKVNVERILGLVGIGGGLGLVGDFVFMGGWV